MRSVQGPTEAGNHVVWVAGGSGMKGAGSKFAISKGGDDHPKLEKLIMARSRKWP